MRNLFNDLNNIEYNDFDLNQLEENAIYEMKEARKALNKIKTEKNVKTIEEQTKELYRKFKRDENLYEEYSDSIFDTKLRVDSLFYEHVLSKLPEETKGVEEAIGSFYKTIKNIYETINIKPESHRMLNSNLLVESINKQQNVFEKILNEHLNNYYYRYTLDQRKEKFLEKATPFAEEMINEGVDSSEAISLSVKSLILESLIKNIAMPRLIQKRVQYLCDDVDYGKVFDQEKLKSLWESFNYKAKNMARIFAIAI